MKQSQQDSKRLSQFENAVIENPLVMIVDFIRPASGAIAIVLNHFIFSANF